jgi:hypothetical protein
MPRAVAGWTMAGTWPEGPDADPSPAGGPPVESAQVLADVGLPGGRREVPTAAPDGTPAAVPPRTDTQVAGVTNG